MIMFRHDALVPHLMDGFRSTLTYSDDLVGIDRQPDSATCPVGDFSLTWLVRLL